MRNERSRPVRRELAHLLLTAFLRVPGTSRASGQGSDAILHKAQICAQISSALGSHRGDVTRHGSSCLPKYPYRQERGIICSASSATNRTSEGTLLQRASRLGGEGEKMYLSLARRYTCTYVWTFRSVAHVSPRVLDTTMFLRLSDLAASMFYRSDTIVSHFPPSGAWALSDG